MIPPNPGADRDGAGATEVLSLHASTLVVREAGILIRGPSGAGKTRLALGLVEQARLAGGFARLVADDDDAPGKAPLAQRGGGLEAGLAATDDHD